MFVVAISLHRRRIRFHLLATPTRRRYDTDRLRESRQLLHLECGQRSFTARFRRRDFDGRRLRLVELRTRAALRRRNGDLERRRRRRIDDVDVGGGSEQQLVGGSGQQLVGRRGSRLCVPETQRSVAGVQSRERTRRVSVEPRIRQQTDLSAFNIVMIKPTIVSEYFLPNSMS